MNILSRVTTQPRPAGCTYLFARNAGLPAHITLSCALASGLLVCASQARAQPADAPLEAPAAAPASAATPLAEPAAPAEQTPVITAEPPTTSTVEPPAKPTPPPYSLPWQLRPAAAATVLRSDTAFAFYENPKSHKSGNTVASMLLGSYKLTDSFAPMLRMGIVSNSPPAGATAAPAPGKTVGATLDSGFTFINPVIGGTYLWKLGSDFRLAAFLGVTLPVGSGGGDTPNPSDAEANTRGASARSAMDNAMFAVNYFTIIPGVDVAYVAHGLTVQAEATLFQMERVRGDKNAANKDAARTNFTTGLHVGYFFIPQLSAGVELRHQRWLSTPSTIKGGKPPYTEDELRDTSTFAFGLRGHIKLGAKSWLRPGVSYSLPLDNPLAKQKYGAVQLDIPVIF